MRGTTAIQFERRDSDIKRLQRAALRVFWDHGPGYVMPLWKALEFKQSSFPSLEKRGYIEPTSNRRGFRMTRLGWALRDHWDSANPFRKERAQQFGASLRIIQGLDGKFDFDEQSIKVRELKRAM